MCKGVFMRVSVREGCVPNRFPLQHVFPWLQDQYRFLYDVAMEFMDSFDTYANFK